MSNIPQTTPALATVTFHGHDLVTVMHEGEIFVALRPIVEAIGLGWQSQYKRIMRHPVLLKGVVIMTTPSDGGEQQTMCLPLKLLNGWLFGVDVARVKPELRERITEYQAECYDVLHAYWTQGQAINPRFRPDKTRVTLPGGLSVEQQDAIKALIKSRAETLPKDQQGAASIRLWSSLKSKYGVSYKAIPPQHFTAALSLVARVPLEGEHLPKPEAEQPPSCSDMLKAFGMFDAAQTFLNQVSLEMITLPQSLETLRGLKAVAELMEESSARFRQNTYNLIENLTTRLGLAA